MTKKFFVNASPRAVAGIRKAYEAIGGEVHAKVGPDGNAVVVAILPEGELHPRKAGQFSKSREHEANAA